MSDSDKRVWVRIATGEVGHSESADTADYVVFMRGVKGREEKHCFRVQEMRALPEAFAHVPESEVYPPRPTAEQVVAHPGWGVGECRRVVKGECWWTPEGMVCDEPCTEEVATLEKYYGNRWIAVRVESRKKTLCAVCGEPHRLTDIDAGSDREMRRLCASCFDEQPTPAPKEVRRTITLKEARELGKRIVSVADGEVRYECGFDEEGYAFVFKNGFPYWMFGVAATYRDFIRWEIEYNTSVEQYGEYTIEDAARAMREGHKVWCVMRGEE